MRRSGAEGQVGRAIGSVMHVGLQGQEGMHVELQSQMVAADVNLFFGCCRASGQSDGLCDACGTGRHACGTAVTNSGGRRQFFFRCCRASGQGDGLCDACGTAGTGRYACGTEVTNGGSRGPFFGVLKVQWAG